jgi:Mlc titration factor MtfA (ptsG expression regulator)
MHVGFGVFVLFSGLIGLMLWYIKSGRSPAMVPIKPAYKKILQKSCLYYRQLPLDQKPVFERKVQHFIMLKRFIPRQLSHVTPEMKTLIAATAVQLTFGLPDVYLRHFRKILVYPDTYYSTISKKYHKGEVNPAWGIIVLSWRNFVEGYVNPGDSINLGLHEMAHALRLENMIRNSEHNFLDEELMQQWEVLSLRELYKIRKGEAHIFRDYAGADDEEFFAIAVENFFERPMDFWGHMPELYRVMCQILNQDPMILYGLRKAS